MVIGGPFAECYGVVDLVDLEKPWYCDRCLDPKYQNVECYLCPLRGGAFKKAYVLPYQKVLKSDENGDSVATEEERNQMILEAIRQKQEELKRYEDELLINGKENTQKQNNTIANSSGESSVKEEVAASFPIPPQEKTFHDANSKSKSKVGAVWAHVTCALVVPEVKFGDHLTKNPIAIQLGKALVNKKGVAVCYYCKRQQKQLSQYVEGTLVKCETTSCQNVYHVSCAHRNGVEFRDNEWPEFITSMCEICDNYVHKQVIPPSEEKVFEVGTQVYAKNKNGRYYLATISERSEEKLHRVYFPKANERNYYVKSEDLVVSELHLRNIRTLNVYDSGRLPDRRSDY